MKFSLSRGGMMALGVIPTDATAHIDQTPFFMLVTVVDDMTPVFCIHFWEPVRAMGAHEWRSLINQEEKDPPALIH
jgi:hypothetical protein